MSYSSTPNRSCFTLHVLIIGGLILCISYFFFFNDTATTEIYTLSLHDALPISPDHRRGVRRAAVRGCRVPVQRPGLPRTVDRKSTRLNSSHSSISYAVFCLKKKKITNMTNTKNLLQTHHYISTLATISTDSYHA